MFVYNHIDKHIKQGTGDMIFHIYTDHGCLSDIHNVQAPDKMKRPQKELSKKAPMDHICLFNIH